MPQIFLNAQFQHNSFENRPSSISRYDWSASENVMNTSNSSITYWKKMNNTIEEIKLPT